jgi:hypothetical protein
MKNRHDLIHYLEAPNKTYQRIWLFVNELDLLEKIGERMV